jgi:hypothetical protein
MTEATKDTALKVLSGFAIIISLLMAFVLYFSGKRIASLKQTEQLYIVAQDSLKTVRNKNGTQTATIEILQADKNKLFTQLQSFDSNIIRLQNVVKQYDKKVGNLTTALITTDETNIKLSDSLKNVITGYSHLPNKPDIKYPIYNKKFDNKWMRGMVTMGLDTFDLKETIINEYDVTIGFEKVSLFKKKAFANITNLNPATETTVMKVYQKTPVKSSIWKPTIIGGAIGFLIGHFIK